MSTAVLTGTARTAATRRSWLTLVAMTGSLSMILLDQTVVSVALPTMARELPLSASGQQWVVNAYVLAMATAVALGGKLGSKLGPVTTFRIGVSVFFVASALCGLAPNASWMIGARIVQGVGAALMMPVSATIVMEAFPTEFRGRAMGVYVGISQIFLALGPLLGGVCTEWGSWRLVFWLNVPVGALALVLVQITRPANHAQRTLRVSPWHAVLLTAGIGATVYALQQSGSWGWGADRTWIVLASGLVVLGGFVALQLRSADPLVQVRLLARRGFLADVLVLFGTQFSMLAMTLYGALYSQNLLGYSPIVAGCSALAMIIPLMAGAQIAGRWYDAAGPRRPVLTGLALTTVGTLLWAANLPQIEYWSKVPGMALAGLGLGLVFSPVNTDALSRVRPKDRPQASGMVQTVRQLGGTLGVAVIGALILGHEHAERTLAAKISDTAHAMSLGFAVAAGAFLAALIAAAFLLPRGNASSAAAED